MAFKIWHGQSPAGNAQKPVLEVICPKMKNSDFREMRGLVGRILHGAKKKADRTGGAHPLAILFSEDVLGTRFDVETKEAEIGAERLCGLVRQSGIWAAVAFSGRQVLEEFTNLSGAGYLVTPDGWKCSPKNIYSDQESLKFDGVFGPHIVKNWTERSVALVLDDVPFASAKAPSGIEIEYVVGADDLRIALVGNAPERATLVSAVLMRPGATQEAWDGRRLLAVNESMNDAPTAVSKMRMHFSQEGRGKNEFWRVSFFESALRC